MTNDTRSVSTLIHTATKVTQERFTSDSTVGERKILAIVFVHQFFDRWITFCLLQVFQREFCRTVTNQTQSNGFLKIARTALFWMACSVVLFFLFWTIDRFCAMVLQATCCHVVFFSLFRPSFLIYLKLRSVQLCVHCGLFGPPK